MSATSNAVASVPPRPLGALRSVSRFLLAGAYFLLAAVLAHRGSLGLAPEAWTPLVEQAMLVFLLLVGYASFGFVLDGQPQPLRQQGLAIRYGWIGEAGLGMAIGWGIAVVSIAPILIFGGIALQFSLSLQSVGWLTLDAAYFALASLALQIAFRGYPLQRAIGAIGELPAALTLAVLYGIWRAWLPGASHASMAVSIALALLLSMAYLRTRALWLPWGLHFGWVASRALLFGLPVDGVGSHSPIIQGEAVGPSWFTGAQLNGADFGLDGSWFSFLLLLAAMPFVYRATRDLSYRYNAPILEPAGIPVDLDAAARQQHDSATRPETPEVKPLVQILPAFSVPLPVIPNRFADPEPSHFSSPDSEQLP